MFQGSKTDTAFCKKVEQWLTVPSEEHVWGKLLFAGSDVLLAVQPASESLSGNKHYQNAMIGPLSKINEIK